MLHYSMWSIVWLDLGLCFSLLGYEHLTAMAFTLHGLCFVVFSLSECTNTLLVSYFFLWCGSFKVIFWISLPHLMSCDWLVCYLDYDYFFKYHFFFNFKTYKKLEKRMTELMNGKRAIGYVAFHFNLWTVKASWLVAKKM